MCHRPSLAVSAIATVVAGALLFSATAQSQSRCDTAFSRIAIGLARKAAEEHKSTICSGLKSRAIAIDKTKRFELTEAQVCENGLVVTAEAAIAIKCGTSDSAVFKVNVEDTIRAKASVDFQRCSVLEASVSADSFAGQVGIDVASLNEILRSEIEKQVQAICYP